MAQESLEVSTFLPSPPCPPAPSSAAASPVSAAPLSPAAPPSPCSESPDFRAAPPSLLCMCDGSSPSQTSEHLSLPVLFQAAPLNLFSVDRIFSQTNNHDEASTENDPACQPTRCSNSDSFCSHIFM